MNLLLERWHSTTPSIDGMLRINGRPFCDTVENVQTSLPEGTYPIHFVRCEQYGRRMMLTNDDPPCEECMKRPIGSPLGALPCVCPMLKAGNGIHNKTDGSILLGARIQSGILIHSGLYFERLYERIKKAVKRDHITLTITNKINQN